MDPVVYAVIIGLISALAAFLGATDDAKEADEAFKIETSVSVECRLSPSKCPKTGDEGRLPPLTPDGVLSPATGYAAP